MVCFKILMTSIFILCLTSYEVHGDTHAAQEESNSRPFKNPHSSFFVEDEEPSPPTEKTSPPTEEPPVNIEMHQVLVRTILLYLFNHVNASTTEAILKLPSVSKQDVQFLENYAVHGIGEPAEVNALLSTYFSHVGELKLQTNETTNCGLTMVAFNTDILLLLVGLIPMALSAYYRSFTFTILAVIFGLCLANYEFEKYNYHVDRRIESTQAEPYECLPRDKWTWPETLRNVFKSDQSIRQTCNEYKKAIHMRDSPVPHSNLFLASFLRFTNQISGSLGDSIRLFIENLLQNTSLFNFHVFLVGYVAFLVLFGGVLMICLRFKFRPRLILHQDLRPIGHPEQILQKDLRPTHPRKQIPPKNLKPTRHREQVVAKSHRRTVIHTRRERPLLRLFGDAVNRSTSKAEH